MEMEPNQGQQAVASTPDGKPEVDQSRAALVKEICEKIEEAKGIFKPQFDRMRKHQRYARGKQHVKDDGSLGRGNEYVANIVLRHINQRTAAIYAKNPRALAKRRQRMDFLVWDGQPESLKQAQDVMQRMAASQMPPQPTVTAGPDGKPVIAPPVPVMPPSPEEVVAAKAIMADIESARSRRAMLDNVAKTLQLIFNYSLDEPTPKFKLQAKQLIRRVLTCSVGYIRLGYQKILKKSPEIDAKIKDASDQLAAAERILKELADGAGGKEKADVERLRILVQTIQKQTPILREGLIFDFPKPWQIIIDPCCTQLKGFVGAEWVAHEFIYSPAKVQEIWGIDLGKNYRGYTEDGKLGDKRKGKTHQLACVWIFYNLYERIQYVVCDGYPDFLEEPGSPEVELEQFHPFFTLTFNDVEDDEDIYPPSDVELLESQQDEYNRSREGRRQHRIASRPGWVQATGALGENAKDKLATHETHEVMDIGLKSGQSVAEVLQPKPVAPVSPDLFEVESIFADVLRVSGDQEANLGGTGDGTATEATIAENTRVSSIQSCTDDVDDLFTDLARAAGQVLLMNMSISTARKIAGPGAVWPEISREEIASEVYLEVKAGSSGRPNRALKINNLERLAPHVTQAPNLNPTWWLKQLVQEVDDSIDIDEAIMDGMPSIVALNNMQRPGTGVAASNPADQGAKGAMNAPKPAPAESGPAFMSGSGGGGSPAGGKEQPQQAV